MVQSGVMCLACILAVKACWASFWTVSIKSSRSAAGCDANRPKLEDAIIADVAGEIERSRPDPAMTSKHGGRYGTICARALLRGCSDTLLNAEGAIMRIHAVRLTLLLAAMLAATPATSQSWPTRPVTLIVPYAAGGSVDVVARVVANKLSDRLGQSVVVENAPGAGGVTGTQRAARAEPDGYTLLFSVESSMAIAKFVQPSIVKYDSLKDFVPISLIGDAPLVLAGKKELPASNTKELLALLKESPGKYNFASSGVGTSLHVAGEMINIEGQVKMVHVPYRVGAQMVTDLVGSQIDLAVLPLVMALPNYRTGN